MPTIAFRLAPLRLVQGVLALWAATAMTVAAAQAAGPGRAPEARGGDAGKAERTIGDWLRRMHEASRQRSYVGTFVVSSSSGAMSSARIWHACEGQRQIERVENLTGAPRSTFRRDDEVLTFVPETKTVRSERRESLGPFPELLNVGESSIPEFYASRRVGSDRVAGYDADVVQLAPKDNLRFGYRIWSEKKSGLVVKLQTVDADGNVLEQAAFSELQLDAPVRMDRLARMMTVPEGWRVEKDEAMKTTAAAEGWGLKNDVAGFKPMSCYKRSAEGVLQWIFSDGLASVSLFVESYDKARHQQEGVFASGATHTLTRRVQDWWLTAVGEVPPQTLKAFALSLERRK
jgi:sigma-E factor negative regulatory protein RseB